MAFESFQRVDKLEMSDFITAGKPGTFRLSPDFFSVISGRKRAKETHVRKKYAPRCNGFSLIANAYINAKRKYPEIFKIRSIRTE